MINYSRHVLGNGMKCIIHEDRGTSLATMNIVFNAGSKFENPQLTGLAHLMEHLMFSGSENAEDFDTPLQLAGGENNAFTNNDITSYYITLPAENIETAFWLESDRMLSLFLNEESLDVQRKVVIEEFRQRYLNQPYGDLMLLLRPEAYKVHSYGWPTIGKSTEHIEKISLSDVREFHNKFYSPSNAVLSVAGNVNTVTIISLAEKWFGGIIGIQSILPVLQQEPEQDEHRKIFVERKVPSDLIYKAWHICSRTHDDFRAMDIFTDLLSGGESGLLYERLVRDRKVFSEVNAWITGDTDPGLMMLYGRLMDGVDLGNAEKELMEVISGPLSGPPSKWEMEKMNNRFEATTLMSNLSSVNKAMNLATYENLGDVSLINREIEGYRSVSAAEVSDTASKYVTDNNCTTLYYKAIK